METRRILHLDLDAFYCAVEEKTDPSLKGKTFAVGGSPTGRGVVTSCSYAARAYGVHSAMPSATSYRLCPDTVFIRSRLDVYRAVSAQIREIFYE